MQKAMMVVDRLDRQNNLLARFFFSVPVSRHNATYEGAVEIRFHTYQSSSGIAPCCQREKPKTLHTTINK